MEQNRHGEKEDPDKNMKHNTWIRWNKMAGAYLGDAEVQSKCFFKAYLPDLVSKLRTRMTWYLDKQCAKLGVFKVFST